MRRAARFAFDVVSVASLAVALVAVVLWVRSYATCDFYGDYLRKRPPPLVEPGYWCAESTRGMLRFCIFEKPLSPSGHYPPRGYRRSGSMSSSYLPFGVSVTLPDNSLTRIWAVSFPHAALSLPLSLPVTARLAGWWRRRARVGGVCGGCGYDLRATRERCPECGTQAATSPPHR